MVDWNGLRVSSKVLPPFTKCINERFNYRRKQWRFFLLPLLIMKSNFTRLLFKVVKGCLIIDTTFSSTNPWHSMQVRRILRLHLMRIMHLGQSLTKLVASHMVKQEGGHFVVVIESAVSNLSALIEVFYGFLYTAYFLPNSKSFYRITSFASKREGQLLRQYNFPSKGQGCCFFGFTYCVCARINQLCCLSPSTCSSSLECKASAFLGVPQIHPRKHPYGNGAPPH